MTIKKSVVLVLILVSFIGLIDAAYLSSQHYQGESVVCELGGHQVGDCNTVLESKYATLFGIPNSLIGILYYFTLLVLASLMFSYKDKRLLQLFVLVATAGLLMSIWFVYLMLFVLKAVCVYCLVSAGATTILFLTSVSVLVSGKKLDT